MRITRHPLLPPSAGLRNIPPDEGVIERLRSSFPLIEARAERVVARFQERLRVESPLLAKRLEMAAGEDLEATRQILGPADRSCTSPTRGPLSPRPPRLVAELRRVVDNLRSIELVQSQLHELGRAHAPRGIRSQEYAEAIRQLVLAMGETIGSAFTTELAQEWTRALELAGTMLREGAGQTVSGLERALEGSRGAR